MPPLSRSAVRARRRPGADRVNGDRGPTNEHDRAVATFDCVDVMLVVGDEPNHDLKRRQDAPGQGFEGARSVPSPAPMCTHWVGWLLPPNR